MQKTSSKVYTTLITAMLALSMVLLAMPPASAETITGRPTIYSSFIHTVDAPELNSPIDWFNVSYADVVRTRVNSYENGSLLCINITGMTITGAQIWLWISETGGAVIEPEDKFYAGPFPLSQITTFGSTLLNVSDPYSGQLFWLGNDTIIGPIPTADIIPKGVEYYVKITDVSPETPNIPSSDVAVSVNKWRPLESLVVTPTSGPAGTQITVQGIAFVADALVNITWNTDVVVPLILVGPEGTFTESFYAPDEQITDAGSVVKTIRAVYNDTGVTAVSTTFTEYGRQWLQIGPYDGTPHPNTWHAGDVGVLQEVWIAGNYFNPRGTVTLYWDYGLTTQVIMVADVPLNGTGFFNVSTTIPESSVGTHYITAVDFSWNFNASVDVVPTLLLVPDQGPVGTSVTAKGYGFPAAGTPTGYVYNVTLTWEGYLTFNITWALTDTLGRFVATFTVPHDYGGDHNVTAVANDTVRTTAWDIFTITPQLRIEPPIFANDGSLVFAIGTGFDPGTAYTPNIDNQYLGANNDYDWTTPVWANATGDMNITFVAAGFRPGLHVFSLYPEAYEPPYEPIFALFTVTTEGDPIVDFLILMNATLVDIKGEVAVIETTVGNLTVSLDALDAKIVSLQDGVATIETVLGTIQASLSDIDAKLVALDGEVATVNTNIGTVQTSVDDVGLKVETISGDVATIKTDLGTISGKVTSIDGGVATIQTDIGTVKADISGLASSVEDVKTSVAAVPDAIAGVTTPIWIAVILSLIAAIAAIASVVQISRKIAG